MKKILSLLLVVLLATGFLVTATAAESASGTCGENLTWEFDGTTGTLTISGEGPMDDYEYYYKRPWQQYQYEIKSVIIEEGVTTIGENAFWSCSGIVGEQVIPDSVTSIGKSAFRYCSITSVSLGKGIKSLGWDEFPYNLIESFSVSEENPYLSAEDGVLFSKDKSIIYKYPTQKKGNYILPDSVKVIKTYAFGGYEDKLIINTVLDEIEPEAFDYQDLSLSTTCSVYFMAGQPLLAYENSFNYYANLYYYAGTEDKWAFDKDGFWNGYNVYPYEDVEDVEFDPSLYAASGYCGDNLSDGKNLAWMIDEDGTLTIKGKGYMRDYSVKKFHTGEHDITDAPWSDYYYDVNKLVIEDGVTGIGRYAFFVMENLKGELIIPDSVRRISDSAFRACVGFVGDITVPEGINILGAMTFLGCNSVSRVNLPSSYAGFFGSQLFDMENLLEINIHEDNANYCSVDGVVLSKDMKKLIIVPSGKTGSYAVPETVESIDSNAFKHCLFSEIIIPSGYTEEFNTSKFNSLNNLESINYHKDNTEYCSVDGTVLTKDGKTLLFAPRGKKGIFTVPGTVETIETDAFRYTLLSEIIIPENVKTIEEEAIYYNSKNTHLSVVVKGNTAGMDQFVRTTSSANTGWVDIYFLDGEPKTTYSSNFVKGHVNMYYLAGTEDKWTFDDNGLWKGFTVTKFYGFGVEDTADHSTHNTEIKNKLDCTCTDYGYTGNKFCSDCGVVYEVGNITAPCHNHTLTAVEAPTCTEDGYTTYTCECGDTYTLNSVAKGHSVNDDGVCDTCGELIEEPTVFDKVINFFENIFAFLIKFFRDIFNFLLGVLSNIF